MSALNQAFLRAYTKDTRGARQTGAPHAASPSSRHSSTPVEAVRHEPAPHVPEPHIPIANHASRVDTNETTETVETARVPTTLPHSFDAGFDSPDQIALAAAFGAIHNVTAVDNLGDWTSLADTLNNHAIASEAAAANQPASAATESSLTARAHAAPPAPVAPTNVARTEVPEHAAAVAEKPIPESPVETVPPSIADSQTESQADSSPATTVDSRLESRLQRVTASRPVFVAAWEVDAFQWPTGCDELLESCHDEFHLAAARFRTATIEGLRVLAVTSLLRREGRSTVAMALARAAAMEGIRVALLDADLDHPNLGSALGFQASVGWPDVLRENIPLAEAAVNSLVDRLTLFPLANPPRRWPMALNTPEVSRLLRDLGQTFELVIVDLGPLAGPASRGFEAGESCPVDAALLVQDVRITTSDQARISAQGLRQAGIGAVGIIENFAAPLAAVHGD